MEFTRVLALDLLVLTLLGGVAISSAHMTWRDFEWPPKDEGHSRCSVNVTHYNKGPNDTVVEETHVDEDGTIIFASLKYSTAYILAAFTSCGDDWLLGPYVRLARDVITQNRFSSFKIDSLRKVVDGDLSTGLIEMAKAQKPILGIGALGFLIGILLPFIGLCFCCCRCKGHCGGRLMTQNARNQRIAWCFTTVVLLAVVFIFLLTGIGALYTVGGRLLLTNDQLTGTLNYTLDDVVTFTGEVLDQLDQVANTDLNFVLNQIIIRVQNLGTTAAAPLGVVMDPKFTDLQNHLQTVMNSIQGIADKFDELDQTSNEMISEDGTLDSVLQSVMTALDNRKASCLTDGISPGVCAALPSSTDVGVPYNFSQIPSLEEQHSFHQEAMDLDIADIISTSIESYQSIPDRITNGSRNTSSDVVDTLRNIADSIAPKTMELTQQINNATKNVDTLKGKIEEVHTMVDDFLIKVDYGLMGLAGIIFMILLLAILGLLHGVTGIRKVPAPERRSAIMHCGRNCLMTSAGMSFLFGMVFFVVGSILFLIGAQLTMVCVSVEDRSILKFVDGPDSWHGSYILGSLLHGNGSVNISIGQVVDDCKNNRAAYDTFELKQIFDVSDVVDIEDKLPDMDGIYDSVRDEIMGITIIENDTMQALLDVSNTTATPMDIVGMMTDLDAGIVDLDTVLSDLMDRLQTAADVVSIEDATYEAAYLALKADVQILNSTTRLSLQTKIATMTEQLNTLEEEMNNLVSGLNSAINSQGNLSVFIYNDGLGIILQNIRGAIDLVVDEANQFITHVDRRLENDIGRCHVVWDIYDGVTYSLCGYFLDSLNGFWLSLSVIALFLIPHIILAVKISKYFRRPDDAVYYINQHKRDSSLMGHGSH